MADFDPDSDARDAVVVVLRDSQPDALTADGIVAAVEERQPGASEAEVRDALRVLEDEDRIERLPGDGDPRYRMS